MIASADLQIVHRPAMPMPGQYGSIPTQVFMSGRLASLSCATIAVYAAICAHCRDWVAWPSVATIASEVGISERTVKRSLRKLVESSLISVEAPGGGRAPGGSGQKTTYRILANGVPAVTVAGPQRCHGAPPTVTRRARNGDSGDRPLCVNILEQQQQQSGAAAVGSSEGEADVVTALRLAGIGEPKRRELATTPGVTAEIVRAEAARLEGTDKRGGILIQNLECAAAKAVADDERRAQECADTEAERRATSGKLQHLAAEKAAAKKLIDGLADERLAELHSEALETCPEIKRTAWERADPRKHVELMREIARLARKQEPEVPA